MTKYMGQNGEILTELGWMILVLTPKGNTNPQGVILMETVWKVVEEIIDTRLRESISFHNILHDISMWRGMRRAILNLKLSQELASSDQDRLFLVFLDLHKSYDTVDQGRFLTTP